MPFANLLNFLIAIVEIGAGYLAAIAFHELGHALTGKVAGLQIVGCGIGVRRPFFRLRVGETHYYIGLPLSGGVTLIVSRTVNPRSKAIAASIAAGPASSLLVTLVATWMACEGFDNAFVISCAAVSALAFVNSAIPMRIKIGGIPLPNDAVLVRLYWRKCFGELDEPGLQISRFTALRDLCRDLGSRPGVVLMTIYLAASQLELGDVGAARTTLSDPISLTPEWSLIGGDWHRYVQSLLALTAGESPAETVLHSAASDLPADQYAQANLNLAAAGLAIEHGRSPALFLEQARVHAQAAGVPLLERTAAALALVDQPPADLASACRHLIDASGSEQLSPLMAAWLSSRVTPLLVERNELQEARYVFHESMTRINAIAKTIPTELTRSIFLSQYAAPLKTAINLADEPVPLFVPDPSPPDETRRRKNLATSQESSQA